MTYILHADEQYWTEIKINEEMKMMEKRATDIVRGTEGYYWITSENRDDVLAVDNFTDAEKIMKELKEENLDDFEHAEQEYPHIAEISSDRPPQ